MPLPWISSSQERKAAGIPVAAAAHSLWKLPGTVAMMELTFSVTQWVLWS
jgi:hypothetical protein